MVNVALGINDAVNVGTGVSASEGWKGVSVAAFGSCVGRLNCAKGSGVGAGVDGAHAKRNMESSKQLSSNLYLAIGDLYFIDRHCGSID